MNWLSYEEFVTDICAEIGEAEGIDVYRKRAYRSKSGRDIEIDASFEADVLGTRIVGLVECKYYLRRVEASVVLAFAKTIEQLGAHKGLIVTTKGFQSGAILEAKDLGIALAVLNPQSARQASGEPIMQFTARGTTPKRRNYFGGTIEPNSDPGIQDAGLSHSFGSGREMLKLMLGGENLLN